MDVVEFKAICFRPASFNNMTVLLAIYVFLVTLAQGTTTFEVWTCDIDFICYATVLNLKFLDPVMKWFLGALILSPASKHTTHLIPIWSCNIKHSLPSFQFSLNSCGEQFSSYFFTMLYFSTLIFLSGLVPSINFIGHMFKHWSLFGICFYRRIYCEIKKSVW